MESDATEDCVTAYNAAKDKLNDCLAIEDTLWRQISKAKWLKEWDKNTHFFHVLATMKRNKAKNFRIHNSDGNWLTDQRSIADARVQYY